MRTLLLARALLAAAVAAQPIVHVDFLVENPVADEFSGVVWIPAREIAPLVADYENRSVIVTTTHSATLEADQQQRRAMELPSQALGGRIAVYLTLKPGEREVVTVHLGGSERMNRLRSPYPPACDGRLLGHGEAAFWQSEKVAYILRGRQIEAAGKLSARALLTPPQVIGCFDLPGAGKAALPAGIEASGPLVAAVQAGEATYLIGRGSRWTQVESSTAEDTQLSLPARPGDSLLEGPHWIASLAGSPAVGLAVYVDPACDGGSHGRTMTLRPDKHGRVRYAFAAFWELEHQENVVEAGEGDVPVPRVPGMERSATTGRILLRPPRMNARAEFEERLRADLVYLANPPKVTRISSPAAALTEAPSSSRQKGYAEALGLMLRRIRLLAGEGKGRFWFSSDPQGVPTFIEPQRSWGDGYFVSLLWDGFHFTGDDWFRSAALDANRRVLGGETREAHATGLNYWDASARSYQETGDAQWRESGLRCAEMMLRIADPVTGLIPEYGPAQRKAPDDPYHPQNYVKIDALVGLPILWWAYEQTGDRRYLDAANRHLRATMKYLIEPDGAALQQLWHDPQTGRILGVGTSQGYGGNSRWARGLAWVLDGLPDAYRVTREASYRAQFERSARWLERNLPPDLIAWYDFDDQGVFWRYRDSGTSAICAYGLLRMSELEPDPALATWYRQFGTRLVNALLDRSLTPVGESDTRPAGMLADQCYTKPQEGEFIWGTWSLERALCWLNEKGIRR